jgi:cytochrome c oxidase subunit 2
MWKEFPLFPDSASSYSDRVDALYLFLLAVSAFFSLLICALVVGFATRYRRTRAGQRGEEIHGSLALELAWTIIPFAITIVIFVWGARVFFAQSTPPADCSDLYVVAKQWMWKIHHPSGQREINDLHLPVGQAVRLTMTSEDVIHSFYIPAFRIKKDVLPGRYSSEWFEATKPGKYHLFCAEYCGTKHSEMIGWVYAMEPQDYEHWLSGSTAGEPAEETGRKLFESMRCDTCHKEANDSPGARGPALAGLLGRQIVLKDGNTVVANEDYVRESILKPMAKVVKGFDPIMPTYEGQLGEEQILQILAYIKTLKATTGTAGAK